MSPRKTQLSDRAIVTIVRGGVLTGAILAAVGTAVSVATGNLGYLYESYNALVAIFTVGFAIFAWLAIAHQPRNRAVWAMATSGLGGVSLLAYIVAGMLVDGPASAARYPNYIPVEHSAIVAQVLAVAEVTSSIGIFVPLTLGLLLFPDGGLASRQWRSAGWFAVGGVAVQSIAYIIALRPDAAVKPEEALVVVIGQVGTFLAVLVALFGLFQRLPATSGATRQQFKWVLWGGLVFAAAFVPGAALAEVDNPWLSPLLTTSGTIALVMGYGVAVGRYRLYDVDLVISRTIVYVSLAGIITGGYVGVVVGLGAVVGRAGHPDPALAIAATAGVAVAFQPLRRRLQAVADRAVYGKRATPHQVLSEFARRAADDPDDLLELLARSLVEGTGADRAEVWLRDGARSVEAARWPDALAPGPEERTTIPLAADGEVLGSLVLAVGPGQRLRADDLALANQVASGAGLALRNRRLTAVLERRVAELRRSRRRLVLVQDTTRRRLERDLHDGAQQQLVALRVRLGLARTLAEREGALDLVAGIEVMAEKADEVIESVRTFARGVYPPLLEAEGLRAALVAEVRRSDLPVDLELDGIGRYDRDLEATVNLCVVEGLRNALAHARASRVTVAVAEVDDGVRFEVADDGVGFDPGSVPTGGRLANLADRVDALSGRFSIESAPGAGTRLVGVIPEATWEETVDG